MGHEARPGPNPNQWAIPDDIYEGVHTRLIDPDFESGLSTAVRALYLTTMQHHDQEMERMGFGRDRGQNSRWADFRGDQPTYARLHRFLNRIHRHINFDDPRAVELYGSVLLLLRLLQAQEEALLAPGELPDENRMNQNLRDIIDRVAAEQKELDREHNEMVEYEAADDLRDVMLGEFQRNATRWNAQQQNLDLARPLTWEQRRRHRNRLQPNIPYPNARGHYIAPPALYGQEGNPIRQAAIQHRVVENNQRNEAAREELRRRNPAHGFFNVPNYHEHLAHLGEQWAEYNQEDDLAHLRAQFDEYNQAQSW